VRAIDVTNDELHGESHWQIIIPEMYQASSSTPRVPLPAQPARFARRWRDRVGDRWSLTRGWRAGRRSRPGAWILTPAGSHTARTKSEESPLSWQERGRPLHRRPLRVTLPGPGKRTKPGSESNETEHTRPNARGRSKAAFVYGYRCRLAISRSASSGETGVR